jgi:hypothetical protein
MYQGGQAVQGGAVGESGLNGLKTRQLQAGNQFAVDRRHVAIVASSGLAMEGNESGEVVATGRNSEGEPLRVVDLEDAYKAAIDATGLVDKCAAAVLQLPASQLSRQLRSEPNYHLSCQRLALLKRDSHVAFVRVLAQRLGLDVVTPDSDAAAMGDVLVAIGRALPRFRMAAPAAGLVLVERRRA